jgi:para-nitrobenzyl esterase
MSMLAAEPAKVRIDAGIVVGSSENGVNVFKGIPFAKPPIGSLRWAVPSRPAAWSGERDATKFALPCPQPMNADGKPNGGGASGPCDEDCLYLNVWAPANAKNAPVMVWLYGGAAFLGAGHLGSYNGSAFARDGVIVVTINYRLGSLGYFSHPALTKAAAPSEPLNNYALLDAIEALNWVRRNIAAFGGNPKNVTVFGQSAGGAMVMNLLAIQSAQGLFHKAIVESGVLLRPGMPLAKAEETGIKAATALGLPGANATLKQLRANPAKAFVDNEATRRGASGVIDGRLMKTAAGDALKSGAAIDVPLIVGTNSGESGADAARTVAGLAASGAPSYLYQFTYVPEWKKAAQPNGAPHSAEIVYVFDSWSTSISGGSSVTANDRLVSARVHSCWVAFAKASPGAKSLNCADGFSWPAYTKENDAIAVFGEKPGVQKAASVPAYVPPKPARK